MAVETFYGPERFTRSTGAPDPEVRTISTTSFEGPFTIRVRSGGASSAWIRLDGRTLLSPRDFTRDGASWAIAISPEAAAELEVTVAGQPGSWIEISVDGVRKPTVFCPTGGAGSVGDLSEAVAATVPGGTILVCDGTHVLDEEVIDRPITLRAQHSGMAIIRDADPAPTFEVARPAIWVRGVASGTVRIVDLRFEPLGHGIEAGGQWDVLEIDSVTFVGRDPNTASPISTRSSTNANARIEVANSAFSNMYIGVFAVTAVEVNVRRSLFENFTQGSVTHSNNGTAGSYSFGRVEDNVMRGCGLAGCIRFFGAKGVIARNRLEVPSGPTREVGILARRVVTHANHQPITIEGNEILGAQLLSHPLIFNAFTIRNAIWIVDQPGFTATVRANRISNATAGALFTADVSATDNVFSNVAFGFSRVNSPHTVTIRRNDFTNYAVVHNSAPGIGGDYRCNWWGSVLGPVNPPANPAAILTPWATAPIAGTNIPCDPEVPMPPMDPPTELRVCGRWSPGLPATVPSLVAAAAFIAPGGTIRFCDGTHVVRDFELRDKGFTLEAEHPLQATLDAAGASISLRTPGTGPLPPFTIRGLRFTNATFASLFVNAHHGTIRVEDAEFQPVSGTSLGAGVFVSGVVGAVSPTRVVIERSRFIGGNYGVKTQFTNGIEVLDGVFEDQMRSAIELGENAGGSMRVERNAISGCGNMACIFASSAQASIRGNTVTIEPRLFITGIWVSGGTYDVTDNTISGRGGTRDPLSAATWPMFEGIHARGVATLARNRVSDAYTGLAFESAAGTASDNVVSDVGRGATFSNSTIAVHRNDFTSYSFAVISSTSPASVTCNWWGTVAGPQNVGIGTPGPNVSTTPFATEPIANQPAVVCP